MKLRTTGLLDALDELLTSIEAAKGSLRVERGKTVRPATVQEIAAAEKSWGGRVPAPLLELWRHGFPRWALVDEDDIARSSPRFAPITKVAKAKKLFRAEATQDERASSPGLRTRARLYRDGFPFTDGENYLVVDTGKGGVWQTSGETSEVPTKPVAPTVAEFLHHYIASGCFDCGSAPATTFRAYFDQVGPHVPKQLRVAPGKNLWLKHLSRFYAEAPATGLVGLRYFERRLKKEARFYAVWIMRDIQPPPYPGGWKVKVQEGGAEYRQLKALLGLRSLTGPKLESGGNFSTREEAAAHLAQAVKSAIRAGYEEIPSPNARAFRGFPLDESKQKFQLVAPIE